ncbi:fused N-acetyl glucosamine-1-phosphate uridyltransferase; glucosamine-1-phosphate acetyl transferase [Nitrospira japonica]|uniref:Bifunctional protein GlmU n=1 Tax=Nitrospira japonica TaxID=1325564 RepID=A0A1W1IB45_9BACT|nr:bifunctional UDP-N-acetylglucosamine diphosphorylase/glucosamine-1-phosphate N-acetyltransferase GlmU [Nitrospira japonica]SLM50258.1 fused N-acetyl glucosamine-1-phosphate uridyltransferase; glucosamine-1-phosphate acetyl transferase [Nitrospira japonica]
MSRSTEATASVAGGHASVPGLAVVVMAAGLGKRMKSKHPKVLHAVAGRAMVMYSIDVGLRVADHRVAVVVGHQAERVRQVIEGAVAAPEGRAVAIVEQREQLGTGHAVLQTRPVFDVPGQPAPACYLILNGDTPLLREETVRCLLQVHQRERAAVTILTANLEDPSGYGRVVRQSADGPVSRIVEDRDAGPAEKAIREINAGTYVVDGPFLFAALDRLDPSNAQGEYYLTDILQMAVAQERRVCAVALDDPDEGLGVNSRRQLAEAELVLRRQIREQWLDAGVTMIDPASTWIDAGVSIGKDTVLHPNVTLAGGTVLGEECIVHSFTRLTDCTVGNSVEILGHCVFREARVDDHATLGPFAHLRPGAIVRRKAKVGNFVEMKHAELGEGSKANHLTYLGDARIGKGVNIGAGTITVNYDGVNKHQTVIGDNVAVGSDTQLIAPVTVGAGAIIAAGTTVTDDVPSDALVIARVPQVNRAGWAARRRALLSSPQDARAASPAKTSKPRPSASRAKRRR